MPTQTAMDQLYMDLAGRVALMSHATRSKVGAILVIGDNIASYGWNGTPHGDCNICEIVNENGATTTKREVLHAESNVIAKCARDGHSTFGATLYVTMSPCFDCAKLIYQAGIYRVVYRDRYRDSTGIDFLLSRGIVVNLLNTAQ